MVLPLVNALALFASGYLLGERANAPAPQSGDYLPPYDPPFSGGQCLNTRYIVGAEVLINGAWQFSDNLIAIFGKVSYIGIEEDRTRLRARNSRGNDISVFPFQISSFATEFRNPVLRPTVGEPDNCGDLPNPNSPTPTNSSGIASDGFNPSAEPNTELAAPLVPFLPSFLAALNAALAAAAAAGNALDGIKAVADAIGAIADLLKKIREDLNEKEKEKEKNKEVLSYEFGGIEKDGFLRLYPSDSFADSEAVQLDILITAIPIGYGKYFGRFSPNYFEYKRLGHIAFVSGSFGIIERKYIEFGRSSFSIPKGCVGFYYHLGLDGIIKANASALYLREVEQIE